MADILDLISAEQINNLLKATEAAVALDAAVSKLNKTTEGAKEKVVKMGEAEKEAERIRKEQTKTLEALDRQRQKGLVAMAKEEAKERELNEVIKMEVKSILDAEKQNKAMLEVKKKLNLATEAGRKQNELYNQSINKNTEYIRQNSDASTKQRMNIGNYPKVLTNVTKSISGLTSGMLPMLGGFALFQNLLTGTEVAGDKFERITSSIGYSLKFLSDRLLTLNFKGLISGFREAWIEGNRYKAVLQEIEDLHIGLGLQEKAAQLRIAQLEMIAKSERSTKEERKAALAEIFKLEAELRTKRIELSDKDTQNELENIAKLIFGADGATDVRKTLILGLVNDQRAFNDNLQDGIKLQDYLNSLIKIELDNMGRANTDLTAYNKAMEGLTGQQRLQLDIVQINTKLSGEQRERIAKAYGASLDALKAEQDAKNALIRLDNKIFKEELKGIDDVENESEKADVRDVNRTINRVDGRIEAERVITDDYIMNLQKREQADIDFIAREDERQAEKAGKEKAIWEKRLNAAYQIGQAMYDFGSMLTSREMSDLDTRYAYELKLAGDNTEKKEKADKKYQDERKKLLQKQAKIDKAMAIFNATINFAQALIAALTVPPPASIVFEAITAALGAIQLATVIATPIPTYAKGTGRAKRGLAVVGEKGRELMVGPDGSLAMTPSTASLVNLGRGGQRIIPNRETELLLRAAKGADDQQSRQMLQEMKDGNNKIVNAIRNKKELHISPDGRKIRERQGDYWKTYEDRKLKL
jgi:hypothetical protein